MATRTNHWSVHKTEIYSKHPEKFSSPKNSSQEKRNSEELMVSPTAAIPKLSLARVCEAAAATGLQI